MKTTTKEVKSKIQTYILNAIDFSDYDETYTNDVKSVLRAYKEQSGPVRGNVQDHFIDFLQGLPGYLNIEYYDKEIIDIMVNEWGLPQPANKSDRDSTKLFYSLIFREFNNLLKKEGLSIFNN